MRRGVLVQHQPLHRLARPPLPMTAPPAPSLHQSRRLEPVLHPGVGPRPAVRLPVPLPEMPHVPARVLPRVQRLQRGDLRVRSLAVRAPGRAHVPKSLQTPCLVPRRPAPERPVAHPQHLGRPRLRHPLAPPRSVHLRKPQHPHFSQHLRPVHPASLSAIRNRTSYVLRNRTDYVLLTPLPDMMLPEARVSCSRRADAILSTGCRDFVMGVCEETSPRRLGSLPHPSEAQDHGGACSAGAPQHQPGDRCCPSS